MIAEVGHALLWLAAGCAAVQAAGPVRLRALTVPAAVLQAWLWLWIAASLAWVFVTTDLSVAGVAATTAGATPTSLKLIAIVVQDGGWLIAATALLAWTGCVLAFFAARLTRLLELLGAAGLMLTLALLVAAPPFARLSPAPTEGAGFPSRPRAALAALVPGIADAPLTLALGEQRGDVTLTAISPTAGPDSTGIVGGVRIGKALLTPEWRETVQPRAAFAVADTGRDELSLVGAAMTPRPDGRWQVAVWRLPLVAPALALIAAGSWLVWRWRR